MRKYKISVIVPVYNTKKYLKRCVDTLTGQTYDQLEILLVDDGSTDGSGGLCDELARGDKRIHVVHKENGGLVSAWKRGVEESTGEYLSFVDSDDWVDVNMLEEMSRCLTGNPREIIASDYVIEREDGEKQYRWQALPAGEYDRRTLERKVIPELLGREHRYVTISRCMKLISRELIEGNARYSDPRIRTGEDTTIMLPALIDCERLVIMDHKAYYHYFYVKSSMIHQYDKGLYENIRLLRQSTLQILEDKFEGEKLSYMLKKADQEHLFMIFLVLKNEARGNGAGNKPGSSTGNGLHSRPDSKSDNSRDSRSSSHTDHSAGGRSDYKKNILEICRSREIRELCKRTPVRVEEKANKLLYLVLRHPNGVTVRLLRLAMVIYYRRGKGVFIWAGRKVKSL